MLAKTKTQTLFQYKFTSFIKIAKFFQTNIICLISGFGREVAENCALLRYYAANSGNSLVTFRDSLTVPSSRIKNPILEGNMIMF